MKIGKYNIPTPHQYPHGEENKIIYSKALLSGRVFTVTNKEIDDCLKAWIERARLGKILDCSYQPPQTKKEALNLVIACKQTIDDPKVQESVKLVDEMFV